MVKLPVQPELQSALEMVPFPRSAGAGKSQYFFWSGNGSTRAAIRDAARTLAAVFKASKVPGAHAHRFRHTLATELLKGRRQLGRRRGNFGQLAEHHPQALREVVAASPGANHDVNAFGFWYKPGTRTIQDCNYMILNT